MKNTNKFYYIDKYMYFCTTIRILHSPNIYLQIRQTYNFSSTNIKI